MSTLDFHRAAIAFHEAEIAKLTAQPVPSNFDVADWRTWWPAMQEQAANRVKAHDYVAPGQGVLREDTGTGEGAPRSFVTHRAIIDAAERGDPATEGGARVFTDGQGGWPGPDGKVFRMDDYKPRGPRAMHEVTEWLWTKSPEGIAWKASPAVQAQLPRNDDGTLADPQLEPISK